MALSTGIIRQSPSQLLDHFGVPTARFDARGHLVSVSPEVVNLFDTATDDVLRHASRIAAGLLETRHTRSSREAIVAPGIDGRTMLRAQYLPAEEGRATVIVLFLVAARKRMTMLGPLSKLSAREIEVATAIASGAPTKAIAARLGISIHTARRHTEKVFAKLGVQNRAHVVLMLHDLTGEPKAS